MLCSLYIKIVFMPKIDKQLYDEVLMYKTSNLPDFRRLYAIVINYKNEGGSRYVAYRTLSAIFENVYNGDDDELCDMMDCIYGTVLPEGRIWPGLMSNYEIDSIDLD